MSKNNITYRYIPRNSFIHRLNPVLKLLSLCVITSSILLSHTYFDLLAIVLLLFLCILCSKTKITTFLKSIWKMKYLFLFIFIINFLCQVEIKESLILTLKMIYMICFSSLFVMTTMPNEITYALEKILYPWKKILKVGKISATIQLSLRFVPLLASEAKRIFQSQTMRGVDYTNSTFFGKIKIISNMIVPLLTISFQKADQIAETMALRLYDVGASRTNYRSQKWSILDTLILLFLLEVLIVILIY